ncbi:MAG: hypothetical protein JWM81_869 [Candidatus Saccharibacteria bacterium]|nr:hypothetical protein [Candidatus Saccharibacteria bacterium]
MTNDLHYITLMLEEEREERKVLSEAVSHILHVLATETATKTDAHLINTRLDTMQIVLTETNADVKVLKQDVGILKRSVKRLDQRVGRLEQAQPSAR